MGLCYCSWTSFICIVSEIPCRFSGSPEPPLLPRQKKNPLAKVLVEKSVSSPRHQPTNLCIVFYFYSCYDTPCFPPFPPFNPLKTLSPTTYKYRILTSWILYCNRHQFLTHAPQIPLTVFNPYCQISTAFSPACRLKTPILHPWFLFSLLLPPLSCIPPGTSQTSNPAHRLQS